MTRILAFTDPHGEASALKAILDLARRERPAIVVCSGDLTYFGMRYEDFVVGLGELGKKVYYVTGNHETDVIAADISAIYQYMKNVGDRWIEVSDVQIMGVPGTDKYWPGAPLDRGTLDRVVGIASMLDRKRPLVLLGHYPPWKCAIAGMREMTPDSGGSKLAREIVEELKPTLMVTGHYHQDFGQEDRLGPTLLINPGPNGRIIEV
jgi:Icc-related predicted phosphoesterase